MLPGLLAGTAALGLAANGLALPAVLVGLPAAVAFGGGILLGRAHQGRAERDEDEALRAWLARRRPLKTASEAELLGRFRDRDPVMRAEALSVAQERRLVGGAYVDALSRTLTDEPVSDVRVGALRGLADLASREPAQTGPIAEALARGLAIRHGPVPGEAARLLGGLGPAATPAVSRYLWDPASSAAVRLSALAALEALGPAAASAVPDLIRVLPEKDRSLRAAAVDALAATGEPGRACLPELYRLYRAAPGVLAGGGDEALELLRSFCPGGLCAVLDPDHDAPVDEGTHLAVPWLLDRPAGPFARVRIGPAEDPDVEAFAIAVQNDPDDRRRETNREAPVEVQRSARLSANTLAVLRRTFPALEVEAGG